MKKQILFAAMGLFLVAGFTSCKKDYTCECTITTNDQFTSSSSTTISNSSKKDAKNSCDEGNAVVTSGNIKMETKCKLK